MIISVDNINMEGEIEEGKNLAGSNTNFLYQEEISIDGINGLLSVSISSISIQAKKKNFSYDWESVLGAKVLEDSPKSLSLIAFPKIKKNHKFYRHVITSESADRLANIIQSMAFSYKMPEMSERIKPRRVKVFVNPNSGSGKSARIWESVSKFFEGCEVNVALTQHRNHAAEIVSSMDLTEFDVIAVVSGDGLVHEVINALCTRPDYETARAFPVSVIPAGSGNALAQEVCEKMGEKVTPEICAFIAVKGKPQPFDISKIVFASGKVVYSFLCVFWAYIADVCIGSEVCRCCGIHRFDCYGFFKLFSASQYNCSITWDEGSFRGPLLYFISTNMEFISIDMRVTPKAEFDDGMNDLLILGNTGKFSLMKLLLRQDSGTHINMKELQYVKTKNWKLNPEGRGVYAIDGERFEPENIEVEVLQKYASIVMIRYGIQN